MQLLAAQLLVLISQHSYLLTAHAFVCGKAKANRQGTMSEAHVWRSHQTLTHTLKESEGLITHFKHMQVDVGRETAVAANDAHQIASKVFGA